MVLRSAFAAVLCSGFLVLAGPAMADDYRPGEFLKLDLSSVLLSPKRLGPETRFGPVPIEARSDRADADASVWPQPPARKTHVAKPQIAKPQIARPQIAKTGAEPPRTPAREKLARRHSNPLDAQARDTRIQTWPCKSGAMCGWQR